MTPGGPTSHPTTPARRLRPAKRAAIETAALKVFAQQGYVRASVQSITDEAGVSTRTLYNHFPTKDALFATVLTDSAARVAERFLQIVADGVRGENAADDVLVIARAIAAHRQEFPEHFQLVRQISSEIHHMPQSTVEAWQAAGPRVVNRAIVGQLRRMSERGQLAITDASLAARQLIALTMARAQTDPLARDRTITSKDLAAAAAVFLHGYQIR
jgi:AcrR family transcriptional regulator